MEGRPGASGAVGAVGAVGVGERRGLHEGGLRKCRGGILIPGVPDEGMSQGCSGLCLGPWMGSCSPGGAFREDRGAGGRGGG